MTTLAPRPAAASPAPTAPARGASAEDRDAKDARTLSLLRSAADATAAERSEIEARVVLDHLGLADAVARRVSRGGGDWADLHQVAYEGLIKAVRRFAPDRGDSFAAFAVPTITGEIKRHLRDLGWSVRPPRRVQELHLRVDAASEQLAQQLGRTPTDRELAAALGTGVAELAEARACGHPLSLDETVGETGARLAETIGDADPLLAAVDRRHGLAEALAALSEEERELLQLRFVEELTQQQIAEALGTTQMQISRLLRRILARLAAELGVESGAVEPRAVRRRA